MVKVHRSEDAAPDRINITYGSVWMQATMLGKYIEGNTMMSTNWHRDLVWILDIIPCGWEWISKCNNKAWGEDMEMQWSTHIQCIAMNIRHTSASASTSIFVWVQQVTRPEWIHGNQNHNIKTRQIGQPRERDPLQPALASWYIKPSLRGISAFHLSGCVQQRNTISSRIIIDTTVYSQHQESQHCSPNNWSYRQRYVRLPSQSYIYYCWFIFFIALC